MTPRADLLALTEDALVSLTNRGLYKRAAKEVAAGTGPSIGSDPAAPDTPDTVRGTFPDGILCTLPPGGLEAATCTCGAPGTCRHVVAVVLAYQATTSDGTNTFENWSPAEFTDAHLEALLGKRTFTTATRRLTTGYLARIHPPTPTEPVPWAELPNCSVRFLVPHDLAYARTDARDTKEAIALAVWAWRAWEARKQTTGEPEDRHFAVGGPKERAAAERAGRTGAGAGGASRTGADTTGASDGSELRAAAGAANSGAGGAGSAGVVGTKTSDGGEQLATAGVANSGAGGAGSGDAGGTDASDGGGWLAAADSNSGAGAGGAGSGGASGTDSDAGGEQLAVAGAVNSGAGGAGSGSASRTDSGHGGARLAAGGASSTGSGDGGEDQAAAGANSGASGAGSGRGGERLVAAGASPGAGGAVSGVDGALELSGSGSGSGSQTYEAGAPEPLASAVDLAADIFLTGVSNLAAGFTPRLARVRRDLEGAGFRWLVLAVEDLADQLAAHAGRGAGHQRVVVADLLAEVVARGRVAGAVVGQPRSRVVGTGEAAEVALRRLRLTALGCRVQAVGEDRRALVFLADPAAGIVLTLDGRYQGAATGADLVGRRLAGSTVGVLAGGNVVTETAHRRADRRLRLAVNRVARTTVSQSGGAWSHLPSTLLARDLDALAAEFDRLPPRLVRPRVDAEDVRVVEIAEVEHLWYEPGSQRLTAVVHGVAGGTARVVSEHRSIAPGALDALAEALHREPRYISATVRRGRGGLVLTPIAVVADGRVIVPDLAFGDGSKDLDDGVAPTPDPLTAAIESAVELLAEMVHRGARHLPQSFGTRLDTTAERLDGAGLGRCAADLRGLNRLLGPDPGRPAFDAWADAAIRLITTAELR